MLAAPRRVHAPTPDAHPRNRSWPSSESEARPRSRLKISTASAGGMRTSGYPAVRGAHAAAVGMEVRQRLRRRASHGERAPRRRVHAAAQAVVLTACIHGCIVYECAHVYDGLYGADPTPAVTSWACSVATPSPFGRPRTPSKVPAQQETVFKA